MFNFLILLKMINYLGRYAAPKLLFLEVSRVNGRTYEQGRDEELDVDFFYSNKVKSLNQDEIRSY